MRKYLLALGVLATSYGVSKAQTIDSTSIVAVQTVSAADLSTCSDGSSKVNTIVKVKGIVTVKGGIAAAAQGRQTFIRTIGPSTVPYGSVDVFKINGLATSPTDIRDLLEGDTILVTGNVIEFRGETEIVPLDTNGVQLLGANFSGIKPAPVVVDLGMMQDANRLNKLVTGEKYEGEFIELQNVEVVFVDNFSGGTRVSFNVKDAAGNVINVSDRFLAQRKSNGPPIYTNGPVGNFVAPQVGDTYEYLRGVIFHDINNCPTSSPTARGYNLNPFDSTHYKKGASVPGITSIAITPLQPTSSQTVTVTATVIPGQDANGVAATLPTGSVTLYYASTITGAYTMLTMTNTSGANYTATIPANPSGTFVRYYITATSSINKTGTVPAVNPPSFAPPLIYKVKDGALTITDLQDSPIITGSGSTGNKPSPYAGQVVTVQGVLTASADPQKLNLGYAFIQQPNTTANGGIWLENGSGTNGFQLGDLISVTGTVSERNGYNTSINVTSQTLVTPGPINIIPVVLNADSLSGWLATYEKYEGMLVKIQNVSGNLIVVDSNISKTTALPNRNFGEWRAGNNSSALFKGTVVKTAIDTTNNFSSLSVSYCNKLNRPAGWGPLSAPLPLNVIRNGDQFASITGVLYHANGYLKLLPRNNADLVSYLNTGVAADITNAAVLYPNPANNSFSLNLSNAVNNGILTISDLKGRVVLSKTVNGSNVNVGIEALATGVYVVSLQGNGGMVSRNKLSVIK